MPPKGGSTALTPIRLPPLPKLKVRRPNNIEPNPCLGIMSTVLGCWASSGSALQNCVALEQQLRVCMDTRKMGSKKKNNINYHLARLYPKIIGPHKRSK